MRCKFVRIKAVLLIYFVITIGFSLYQSENVEAEQRACCEKTRSGDYCSFTNENNCDSNFRKSLTSCEQTSFCGEVCCVGKDACFSNVGRAQCIANGGVPNNDATCGSISECRSGCCVVGNQCSYTTENNCKSLVSGFSLDFDFRNVNSELACLNICANQEQGCCVDSCSYGSSSTCNGEFKSGKTCNSVAKCSSCVSKAKKGCVGEDVYWFDSCGNKEGLAQDCNYIDGNICLEKDDSAQCSDLNCGTTTRYEGLDYTGGSKSHGESWCVYESPTGNFLDRPGSRHYEFSCINGEEVVTPCREFREQICVQSKNDKSEYGASCLDNDIYDSAITEKISTVPQGNRFWDTDETNECSEGSSSCTVIFVKEFTGASWHCEANCHCMDEKFISQAAAQCKQFGDCGADLNILGERGDKGLKVDWSGHKSQGRNPVKVDEDYWKELDLKGIFGGMEFLGNELKDILAKDPKDLSTAQDITTYSAVGGAVGAAVILLNVGLSFSLVAEAVSTVVTTIALGAATGAGGSAAVSGAAAPILTTFAAFAVVGAAVILLAAITLVVLYSGADSVKKTVKITCNPWIPPTGGEDCEKCTDDPNLPCTEYKCKSLGASCKLINGDDPVIAECINANANDVNSPIITPWTEIIGEDLEINARGFEIKDKVEAFKPFKLAFLTDEPALCRYDLIVSKPYEEMENNLDNYYVEEHLLELNVEPSRVYEYYLKCEDAAGNKNDRDYKIKFTVDNAPDITPPRIVDSSIPSGVKLPFNLTSIPFSLTLNEPATCRFGKEDKPFRQLSNISLCDLEYFDTQHDYQCLTVVSGLQRGKNTYYYKCQDLKNNTNTQSYVYDFHVTDPLEILEVGPEGELFENNVELNVKTSDDAQCFFKSGRQNSPFVRFTDTNSTVHKSIQSRLQKASYTYNVECIDYAGNYDSDKISFKVMTEPRNTGILYSYRDFSNLYLVFNEKVSCEYSDKSFRFGDGEPMSLDSSTQKLSVDKFYYYINCKDSSGNNLREVVVYT